MRFCPSIRSCLVYLLLFCTVVGTGYVVLLNGLQVERLALDGVIFEDATLKWDNGLSLDIAKVQLNERKRSDTKKINGTAVQRALKTVRFVRKIVPSITIHSIQYKKYKVQLSSREEQPHQPLALILNSDDLYLEATVFQEQDDIRITLTDLFSKQLDSSASGSFFVDAKTFQGRGELTANLAGCLPVQLSIAADLEGLSFQGQGDGEITTIKPFVDLFGLRPDIQPWITEYLNGSRYHLQAVSGNLPWRDPAAILDSLTAKIRVDGCTYAFASGLEPIRTEYTEVTFNNGVLEIFPHGSSFYGQDGEKSWLDINFNDPENILLTAKIKTRARANADILNLLAYYGIQLPFLQKSGKVSTDLTLAINLNREHVQASGVLEVGESLFVYDSHVYHVESGLIKLNNSDITIEDLVIGVKELFRAKVDGSIQPQDSLADLSIAVEHLSLDINDTVLTLEPGSAPLQLNFQGRPRNSTLAAPPSHWSVGGKTLYVDAFSMPFDYQKFSGKLPMTRLVVPGLAEFVVGGSFNGRKQLANLQATVLDVHLPFLSLTVSPLALHLDYDQQLHITAAHKSSWQFSGSELTLFPFDLWWSKEQLRIEKGQLHFAGLLDTLFKGAYDFNTQRGRFHLNELAIGNSQGYSIFNMPGELMMDLGVNEEVTWVNFDELGLFLLSQIDGEWDVALHDFSALYDHSPLLQRLKITKGTFHLVTPGVGSSLQFSGEISSDYSFLVRDGQPQSDYIFSGEYSQAGLNAVVNKDLQVHYGDGLEISSRDIGYNVPAFIRYRKETRKGDASDHPISDFTLKANDGYLFFREEYRILADTMTLTGKGGQRDLVVTHGQGDIKVQMIGDSFSLKGQGLNDQFINALAPSAKFEGGNLSGYAEGTVDRFTALVRTDETLLKEYAMLNNILAVVNTLPALITFTFPQYDSTGWPVDSTLCWFDYDQGTATVKAMELNSPEMDLRGIGTVDLFKQQVDLNVNMLTQAGQNMSKIPLIGYILAGEERRPTLSFHVTGDLLDPTVESTAFEEVLTMPFEMVFRTMATPFRWVGDLMELEQVGQPGPGDNPVMGADNQEQNQ